MTANTQSISSNGTHSPNRSVIEHTKMRRGLRQRSGALSVVPQMEMTTLSRFGRVYASPVPKRSRLMTSA
jgi:hypothetical protein